MTELVLKKRLNKQAHKFESDAEDHANGFSSAPMSLIKEDRKATQKTLDKIAKLSNEKMMNHGHLISIDPHTTWLIKMANVLSV